MNELFKIIHREVGRLLSRGSLRGTFVHHLFRVAIDIKKDGRIFVAVEVKDKQFSEQDVDHAAFKASQYGLKSITFIIGASGECTSSSLEQVAKTVLLARDINVVFIDLVPFVRSIVALCSELPFATFFEKLQYYAISARIRDEVFEHIERVFQSIQISSNPPSNIALERTE